MNAEARTTFSDLLVTLRADEVAWVARVEKEASRSPMLLGQGYMLRSGNLALLLTRKPEGLEMRPVGVEPHLCGFTLLGRADAERVAKSHPGQYKVEHIHDTAKARLAEVRGLITTLEGMLAAA
jgi:hypothetical protein